MHDESEDWNIVVTWYLCNVDMSKMRKACWLGCILTTLADMITYPASRCQSKNFAPVSACQQCRHHTFLGDVGVQWNSSNLEEGRDSRNWANRKICDVTTKLVSLFNAEKDHHLTSNDEYLISTDGKIECNRMFSNEQWRSLFYLCVLDASGSKTLSRSNAPIHYNPIRTEY